MNDIAIKVENLSKRYRIGLEEKMHDTMAGALMDFVKRPVRNLRQLRRLTRFSENGHEPEDVIWALKDVSFEVERGEVVGIIGRNGAGKSTLLKILSRITHPTSGRVELKGRVSSLLEVGTGFHQELTGRENIYLNGTILGMRKAEIDRKFDEIVEFSGVEKFIDTPVKRYSSGMRVRLAFSVAAHLEPEVLLIDEVLAVGDLAFQRKCLNKMDDVSKEGRTILFVSHSMASIDRLCTSCVWLEGGRIKLKGATRATIDAYVGSNQSDTSVYTQPRMPEKAINVRRVAVHSETGKGEVSEVKYNEDFEIVVDYEINKTIEALTVSIALLSVENVVLLASAEYDLRPELLGERAPGYYQSALKMPSRWLNAGHYVVRVFAVDVMRRKVFDRVDAIRFTVVGTGDHIGVGARAAHFIPLLPWRVDKLQEHASQYEC